jgi:ribosomal protein S27AE
MIVNGDIKKEHRQLKCPNCGAEVVIGQLKCSQCGTHFKCDGIFDEACHWYRLVLAIIVSVTTAITTTYIVLAFMK